MNPQSCVCRAGLLLLAFATSVIEGKVRVLDNKGMKVFVLDEGAYSNLQYFLEELDAKRNQLYSAFPGSSPKSAFKNENLVELEDRVPVIVGVPKRSSLSSSAEEISHLSGESGGDQPAEILNRKSDEWLRNPGQSYSPSSPVPASAHAGHQQSSYYSVIQSDDSPAVTSTSSDSQSPYESDRYSDYAGDLRSESTTSVKQESPIRSLIRRWSRN